MKISKDSWGAVGASTFLLLTGVPWFMAAPRGNWTMEAAFAMSAWICVRAFGNWDACGTRPTYKWVQLIVPLAILPFLSLATLIGAFQGHGLLGIILVLAWAAVAVPMLVTSAYAIVRGRGFLDR